MPTAERIRRDFIEFFEQRHGHTFVPSSPVVPHQDPTLLFTNAGMNQFKDVFLGRGDRPYTRAANSQKCIRAGGKHNDLEDVGKDHYHHTFFEMLGNWSFGDYFKAEAIEWAWALLTGVWGLDPGRLHATVFAGDDADGLAPDEEAEALWGRFLPAERIGRWGRKDNFWEMGETGPCGPCSEIHYDGRPDEARRATPASELVNRDHPDVIEIWNLVFIQFNRGDDGVLTPLPAKHVDTGMGFERIVRFLQNKTSNYDTDVWTPIFAAIREESGARAYGGAMDDPVDVAYRVVADHVRCLTVALTDGGRPGPEKAGFVLRRILRRAVRHAHQTLGVDGPLLHRLVPAVVDSLGGAFPELRQNPDHVAAIIRDEEESFLKTLDRGLELFADAAERAAGAGSKRISGDDAFKLHDTYGFPIDLTRVMAEERGMAVDVAGFEARMEKAREVSRAGGDGGSGGSGGPADGLGLPPEAIAKLQHLRVPPTADEDKYQGRPVSTKLQAIWNGRDFDNVARVGATVALITARTNHYAEAGGQVGDRGTIEGDVVDGGQVPGRGLGGREASGDGRFQVEDTRAEGGYVLHVGRVVDGKLSVGERVVVRLEADHRGPVRANHTATHLLNRALREVIGDEEDQRGSLVAPDRLRFDFTCPHAMSREDLATVEGMVSRDVEQALAVHAAEIPLATARRIRGVRAVFGERYPDPVRVVCIGAPLDAVAADPENERWRGYSIEFCGGTHLERTAGAQSFVIVHEQALAAGVRRVTALTGPAALAARAAGEQLERRLEQAAGLEGEALLGEFDDLARQVDAMTLSAVTRHGLHAGLEALRGRVKSMRKQADAGERDEVVARARAIADGGDGLVIVDTIEGASKDSLLSAIDTIRAKRPDTAAMLFAPDQAAGKVAIVAMVPSALIERGLKAGDWVRQAARVCGGGGGGRPDMAQAGGKDPAKVPAAVAAARDFAESVIGDEKESPRAAT